MPDLTAMEIMELLKDIQRDRLPELYKNDLQLAAVLVPMLLIDNGWHLLFTRRTEIVNNHKGQISFPGGRVEPCDASL
ncbi:MAG: hypothetical protein MUO76_12780, partial [Anaerolineaceae bacterium]|nr:hypothetical protein [Anaerolineaceae bacterium]